MVITPDLVKRTLLDNSNGFQFENFVQAFFSALQGQNYKPVGGIHDGGADGIFEENGLFEIEGKNTHFIQISIDKNPKAKIVKTIKRLLDYERNVEKLTYITSIVVNDMDKIEDDISEAYNLRLQIRDANFIASNIQFSRQTEEAFKNNLLDTYDFLRQFGHSSIKFKENHNDAPFVYAFLQQELNNKTDRSNLVNSLTDSLIIWALEGTDPDKKKFMRAEEIHTKILESIPTAKTFINSTLKHRLAHLHKKENTRKIQYWSPLDSYCLPLETRKKIIDQNILDEELYASVQNEFNTKIIELSNESLIAKDVKQLTAIALRTLHITFENEGLEFISFIENPENVGSKPPVVNNIEKAFDELKFTFQCTDEKEIIRKLMVHIFYQNCNDDITLYLQKLSETYALLLSLKADTRVVDYFQNMSKSFSLFIGSDILVSCLAERFLHDRNKATTNMLKIISDAGSTLFLTELVLDEIWNNLKTSDWEYKNHFASIDQYMKPEIAKESHKILIRAYYYSKFSKDMIKANSWVNFVEQFCTYTDLHDNAGRNQLKRYLTTQFNLTFLPLSEIEKIIDSKVVEELANKLVKVKKREELATNAATMVDLVYKKRQQTSESSNSNRFGYSTWWLTGEKTTFEFTASLVKENLGFYIIRLEFLMHYISLMPTKKEVKDTYKNIFPTMMGIQMSGRISPTEYYKLLNNIDNAKQLQPGRLEVLIEDTINKLKSDFVRRYNDFDID